ncbi:MAG TPA: Maf family protein [Armatimonadota bacterium]|nr:Maf family protein [Armatimonadota bacterium]
MVLASGSPRRVGLLRELGLRFSVVAPDVDEASLGPFADPPAAVEALAYAKASRVAAGCRDGLVLGFDTAVVIGDVVLGKPTDTADAVRMIQCLAGQEHEVLTGLCVLDVSSARLPGCDGLTPPGLAADGEEYGRAWMAGPGVAVGYERSFVRFGPLSPEEARAYVALGESLDKAGAYGIQGKAAIIVQMVRGCYYNVVGLPLYRLAQVLRWFDADLLTGAGLERT